jgi:hypothetical protein
MNWLARQNINMRPKRNGSGLRLHHTGVMDGAFGARRGFARANAATGSSLIRRREHCLVLWKVRRFRSRQAIVKPTCQPHRRAEGDDDAGGKNIPPSRGGSAYHGNAIPASALHELHVPHTRQGAAAVPSSSPVRRVSLPDRTNLPQAEARNLFGLDLMLGRKAALAHQLSTMRLLCSGVGQ